MQRSKKSVGIIFIALGTFALIFCCVVLISTPFFDIRNIANTVYGDLQMVENINTQKTFGKFVNACFDDSVAVSLNCSDKFKVELKLLNIITIKSFYVNNSDEELFAGGDIVGFSLNGDGVVIISVSNVSTKSGDVTLNSEFKNGDIIKEIQGQKVTSVADICRVVNKSENVGIGLSVTFERNGKTLTTTIKPALDKNSGLYKLGLWVKDDVSGIGTLTYIKKDNDRFGALGHAIADNDTKTRYSINNGEMYNCTIIGLKKGSKGKAGELKGLFLQGANNQIGNVDKNCEFGVFGNIKNKDIEINKQQLKAGGRLYVKPGKAYIRTSIDGKKAKDYEIEIVKTNYQSKSNEKSMLLRVTDKELLEKSGGIVQGMSGSPIIQNDRIVGAVTHVFLNDSTKGFGVYLDWMINE